MSHQIVLPSFFFLINLPTTLHMYLSVLIVMSLTELSLENNVFIQLTKTAFEHYSNLLLCHRIIKKKQQVEHNVPAARSLVFAICLSFS
jgi:hypothetical protein